MTGGPLKNKMEATQRQKMRTEFIDRTIIAFCESPKTKSQINEYILQSKVFWLKKYLVVFRMAAILWGLKEEGYLQRYYSEIHKNGPFRKCFYVATGRKKPRGKIKDNFTNKVFAA
jgi:hypothetical protein